jgi:hypothetical protein
MTTPVLVKLSLVALVIGWIATSEATLGVAFIATAIYVAVLARLRQADAHYHATAAARSTPAPAHTGPPPLLRPTPAPPD